MNKNNIKNIQNIYYIDMIPIIVSDSPQKTTCTTYLHDYISCIYKDEKCCAELYQMYKKCVMNKVNKISVNTLADKTHKQ